MEQMFSRSSAGPMNTPISQQLLKKSAVEYGLPQIDMIKPRLVICLGKDTFNALRASLGLGKVMTVEEGIEQPFTYRKTLIWLQAHGYAWTKQSK